MSDFAYPGCMSVTPCGYYLFGCDLNCQKQKPMHHKDCFFYDDLQDMNATIPCCDFFNKGYGDEFDCKECNKYVSKSQVYKLIKEAVNNGGLGKVKEEK